MIIATNIGLLLCTSDRIVTGSLLALIIHLLVHGCTKKFKEISFNLLDLNCHLTNFMSRSYKHLNGCGSVFSCVNHFYGIIAHSKLLLQTAINNATFSNCNVHWNLAHLVVLPVTATAMTSGHRWITKTVQYNRSRWMKNLAPILTGMIRVQAQNVQYSRSFPRAQYAQYSNMFFLWHSFEISNTR